MDVKLEKYSGAGNDFIVLDGRSADVPAYRDPGRVRELCSRKDGFTAPDGTVGADGLMILSSSESSDFRMEFFNPDGSSGMMCGNGGDSLAFEAPDGLHTARILSREGNLASVCLGMKDVDDYRPVLGGWFLDTGTRHFVLFGDDVDALDVETLGAFYRRHEAFAPAGVNADFVQRLPDGSLKVRTFEKGVEAETLACGTGIVASAMASVLDGPGPADASYSIPVHARRDALQVGFDVGTDASGRLRFTSVLLTGPAEHIV